MSDGIYIIGAGGHAKVVISTLLAAGKKVAAIFDDDPGTWDSRIFDVPIQGPIAVLNDLPQKRAIVAIGNNEVRKRIVQQMPHVEWVSVIHPRAYVHVSVVMGPGSVIFAGAIIQPETRIGAHVIVNTGATVDHDCCLEDYVHVCPGSHLAGGVILKTGVMMGIGAVAIQEVEIGEGTVVGAGAVVIHHLPSHITAVGVPARPLQPKVGT